MKYSEYLKDLDQCPFCDNRKERVIENDLAFLTFSVAPYHADHLLVMTKRHVEHILDLTEAESQAIASLQKQGLKILMNLGYTNVSLLVKEGDRSEKSIAHTHYHLIPNVVLGDSNHQEGDRALLTEEERVTVITKIKNAHR